MGRECAYKLSTTVSWKKCIGSGLLAPVFDFSFLFRGLSSPGHRGREVDTTGQMSEEIDTQEEGPEYTTGLWC